MTHTFWHNGNSAGPHRTNVDKLCIHTTEGSSIEGAIAAYKQHNSWPHDTVDFRHGVTHRICRHLPYNVAARSLRNVAGGVQTNSDGVIQVEVVGFAANPGLVDWEAFAREYVAPVCAEAGVPVQSSVDFVSYPDSYGQNARQRLSGGQWTNYQGILGHQNVPENSHGDPGAIPIDTIIQAAGSGAPPPTTSKPPYKLYERNGMLFRDVNSGSTFLGAPGYWTYVGDGVASAVLERETAYGPPVMCNGPEIEAVKNQFLGGQTADDPTE